MESDCNSENDLIRGVMESMGWSDSYNDSFLPIANVENKKLLERIKYLGKTKLERDYALEGQQKEEVRVQELVQNADNEFDQNLKLITAHKSQFTTEHHLLKLSEHEESKFRKLTKETVKESDELIQLDEKLKRKGSFFLIKWHPITFCAFFFIDEKVRINESMGKLSEGIQWAKSALLEWRQVMASGDEANKMIEKLCRVDAGRAEV